jgi:hypothetical protein
MVDRQADNNFQDTLSYLLELDPGLPVCEAIRDGHEQKVRETSLNLKGLSTISPKREAIIQGRADFLKLLLANDNTISEDLVAIACQRKDRDSVRTLLDFGWHVNSPVYSTASLLWLVKLQGGACLLY